MQIRIARPTDKLDQVVAFYNGGLGFPILFQFENHAGYSGVMLGMPTDQVHLEFTRADAGSPCPAPTKDNLLVLYLTDDEAHAELVQRMKNHGHGPVAPENPYWKNDSLTFEDPDGWRVVIYRGPAFRGQ
jgi:catechol 2,3-dioxygenase-like lactoylglutathione lyase family enzyme